MKIRHCERSVAISNKLKNIKSTIGNNHVQ